MKYLLILSILIISFSCEENNSEKKLPQNSPGTFIKTFKFKNGKKKSQISFVDSLKNGVSKDFYENGNVHLLVNYKDNEKHGESIFYYEKGGIYRKNKYVNNKKEGLETFYYEDGKVQSEQSFYQGMIGNDLKEYTKSGKLKKKYPKLILEQKTNYQGGSIVVKARLDNHKKAVFEINQLFENKYRKIDKYSFQQKEKEYYYTINFMPGEVILKTVKINAFFKTRNGRIMILSKRINVAAN